MASTLLQNTFASTYRDDFRDSDNYYRILFNSGRALQARELTQLQTIIQKESERFARYVFNEGSVISSNLGTTATRGFAGHFVKLDTSVNQLPTDYTALENTTISNDLASPVSANIIKVIPATGSDPATLVLTYVSSGNNSSADLTKPISFEAGQDLTTTEGTLTIQTTDTVANPAVGRTALITIPENQVFSLGHFVFTPRQTLIVNKYNDIYSGIVGYKVTESIVSASDNVALYDNTGSNPNLTSPGADRYRITLTLAREEDLASDDTFIPLVRLRNGDPEILQDTDNILNRLGDTLAVRTAEVSGNFVTKDKEKFRLQVLADSDEDYLRYSVSPGTAYIKGFRVTTSTNTEFRVKKPRTTNDIVSFNTEAVVPKIGNYFLADSMYGMVGLIDSNAIVNMYDSSDLLGNKIGEVRLRHVEKVASEDYYKLYVYEPFIDSNGSGTKYNFSTVRSIGLSGNNKANLVLTGGQQNIKLLEQKGEAAYQNLRYTTPYNITSATMNVAEVFRTTTTGAGKAVFGTSAVDEVFSNQSDWILKYDSGGEIVSSLDIESGGVGETSMRLGSLSASQPMTLLAYVNITADPITASPRLNQTSTGSLTNREYTIPTNTFTRLIKVVDNTSSENISYKFFLRERTGVFYRSAPIIRLKDQYSPPAGTITVTYNDYEVSSGDYFNINSYSSFAYRDIPTNPNGITMRNVLDFRPSKDVTGSNFTGTGANVLRLPKNNSIINLSGVSYYQGRVDTIYIDPYSRKLKLLEGDNKDKVYPRPTERLPSSVIPLHQISINPYTFNNEDLTRIRYQHKHYRQTDIATLDKRIGAIEQLTALTLTETNVMNESVTDDQGRERTKLGVTADNFKTHIQSLNVGNVDFRASLDLARGVMRPKQVRNMVSLFYDSDNSNGIRRFGNILIPDFTENVLIEQTIASKPTDVNQMFVPKFTGTLTLAPEADLWTERRTIDNGNTKVVYDNGDLSTYDKSQEYGG